jgi:hypothetical protein
MTITPSNTEFTAGGRADNSRSELPWLFSGPVDLAAFLVPTLVAFGLVALGARFQFLKGETPEWTWISAVLLVDVAHVYATAFRVYFDPVERRRRAWLYTLIPVVSLLAGMALYSTGEMVFWRALAYLAVFHFVRQQYGWVALYRARAGEHGACGRWVDTLAIYLATIYPLVYWHAHLPRGFWWFLDGDFVALPPFVEKCLAPVYWGALAAYAGRSLTLAIRRRQYNPGKDIVVATTALCWYTGIVATNSDYVFTVTNVLIHGVPYMILVHWFGSRHDTTHSGSQPWFRRLVPYLATVWLLAYCEELFWDRGVWHERTWLFGQAWNVGRWNAVLVPLLAVPQMTHYLLDGFIWKRRRHPDIDRLIPPA